MKVGDTGWRRLGKEDESALIIRTPAPASPLARHEEVVPTAKWRGFRITKDTNSRLRATRLHARSGAEENR
jgi:hypothetical protein